MELEQLLDRLHAAALETGVFPRGGIRVRAHRIEHYRVADCHPDNAYVHITAMLGHGRPVDVRRQVGEALMAVIISHFEALFAVSPLALSFTIEELHPELNFKHNNLHEYVRRRQAQSS